MADQADRLGAYLQEMPIVAILRGLRPEAAVDVGEALSRAGIRILEVPLNSPSPLESISRLAQRFGDVCLVGAGTVTQPSQVTDLAAIGASIVVSPNTDPAVVAESRRLGLISCPGALTPSEVFQAHAAGADAIKIFPASVMGPSGIKAMRAVVPSEMMLLAVGGVSGDNMAEYMSAGANGLGLGTALFAPDMSLAEIRDRAARLTACARRPVEGADGPG